MVYLLKAFFLFIAISCFLNSRARIFDNEHERLVWRQDSCGCNGERFALKMQVMLRMQKMTAAEVENELGKPARKVSEPDAIPMEYYPILAECNSKNQVKQKIYSLVIEFRNDTVVSCGLHDWR